ncbi:MULTISPECIES: ROK family protein [Vibrio]|uniref:ROK family protein n=1 Tax=Vibrio TaxID=662 RepID=UPI00030DAA10|nr:MULTISPECIES: ROK family protein [Vibrio]MDH5877798.1 ROK family protein [Vibrio sp. S/42/10]OEE13659.1 glucokinase [Vibrio cyclitrophicus ZF205]PMF37893.1 glucokinase [Vibrio cyclitrophicus]
MTTYLSFDIGGTDIKFGVVNDLGDILRQGKVKTASAGEDIIQTIVDIKQDLSQTYRFDGAAFSVPGFVNVDTGYLKAGGAISDFCEFNFKDILADKLALPVEVENDVNCVALAEKWQGKAKDMSDFICITLGTGIGGAIYTNNQLIRGHRSMAGEFGYTFIHYAHESQDKASETMNLTASVRDGLRRRYALYKGLSGFEHISGKDIFSLAEGGDSVAVRVIDEFYKSIAVGLHNLTFILNPEKIIIGGAISERPDLIPNVTQEMKRLLKAIPVINKLNLDEVVSIENTSFTNDNGLIGAVYHFLIMREKRTQ